MTEPMSEPTAEPVTEQMTEPPTDQASEPGSEPVYASVEEWVSERFIPMYRRTLGGEFRWCAQWWKHAEAISRLTALWHAWEALRLEAGTGMGVWYRDHLDHQLPILLGPRGPFYQCSEDEHLEPHQANVEPAPAGWWAISTESDSDHPPDAPHANSHL